MNELIDYLFMISFDCLFSIFFVLNLVVFVWRIIWDTQDLYLTNNNYLNSIISILISFIIILYIKFQQIKSLSLTKPNCLNKAKIKFFILLFGFANVNHWRGVWNLTLLYTNKSHIGILTIGLLSIIGLIAMNRLCALISVPYILNKDCAQLAYQIQPFSKKSNKYLKLNEYNIKMTRWLFMFNFMLEYFADIFTIQGWRSLWFFMDEFVYKQDSTKSALISLTIGVSLYLMLHVFNKPINKYTIKNKKETILLENNILLNINNENYKKKKLSLNERLFLYVIFILGFVSTVNSWRALWMLQLDFCYPILIKSSQILNQNILNLLYMLASLLILWFIHLTSAVLSRASCEDDYFTAKNNFIVKHNNFEHFIKKKVKKSNTCLDNAIKWKELVEYKLLCNKFVDQKEKDCEKKFQKLIIQNDFVLKLQENVV